MKLLKTFLLIFIFFSGNIYTYAREKQVEIPRKIIEKEMPAYAKNLKQLLGEAEQNLAKIETELKKRADFKNNQEKERFIRKCFEEGNLLYKQGYPEKAVKEWEKALKISNTSEMRGYIRCYEKKLKEEEVRKEKAEKGKQRELKKETQDLYVQAVFLYKRKAYAAARKMFKKVQQLFPDYLRTNHYLKKIIELKK
ncbi:MAG: tetratricopeptide repeat protein [Candidatus Aureabacteria bacterium]|nr:tetratricopeptide repeat protein [Candidatus Auribacterota bacterium]